jgi:hypothetical protein
MEFLRFENQKNMLQCRAANHFILTQKNGWMPA